MKISTKHRCEHCENKITKTTHDGYKFAACTHEIYKKENKSKPVWEVKICPIGKGELRF